MTVEHIVWDWNGTLLGDGPALIEATIEAFRECGLPAVTRESYQRHHVQPIPLFYSRLAGRELTDAEQSRVAAGFQTAYEKRRTTVRLTADALAALGLWAAAGRSQSLLSMYPHDLLMPLVSGFGLDRFFTRVDGSAGRDVSRKAPFLARHLRVQGIDPARAVLIGDSVDDVAAAAECGVRCVVYHAGADALHDRSHFESAVAPSLVAAVSSVLDQAADRDGGNVAGRRADADEG
ncbi:haloacid dehalogenase-like hydrolase [Actinoplanes sp. NPDC051411]|uniref:HAD family hydrolase n=1 Tax=Actinoplanes sp. NPDC051411 TaxID=3155522 RepID=UPI0034489122